MAAPRRHGTAERVPGTRRDRSHPLRLVAIVFPFLLLALSTAAPRGEAHQIRYSWLEIRVEAESVAVRFTANMEDLAREAGSPIAIPSPGAGASCDPKGEPARALATLPSIFEDRTRIRFDDQPAPTWKRSIEGVPERGCARITWKTRLPRQPSRIEIAGLPFPADPQHETYLNVYQGTKIVYQGILDRSEPLHTAPLAKREPLMATVWTFTKSGVHHIFTGPDHILFVIALLLMGGSAMRLLKIVSAFTVAHSITLALASLAIVRPPASIIEPAIALSIVCVGIENLLPARMRTRDRRPWLAFGFGFIHGFGFANVLGSLDLPRSAIPPALASFNIGVEIGQAAIVLSCAPILALLRRSPRSTRMIVVWGSACVILAGGFWFVERILPVISKIA